MTARIPRIAGLSLLFALAACGSRVTAPEDTVLAWADAIDAGRCDAAARLLDESARGGRSADDWSDWCAEHLEPLQTQVDGIRSALADDALTVEARVPLDIARDAHLVHVGGGWAFAEQPPLLGGGDDPVDALESLAAVLSSPGMQDVLAVLSDDTREQYAAEIRAITAAMLAGSDANVRVTGDSATVDVGPLTVRLVREDGAWRVDEIDQGNYGLGLGLGY